MSDDFEPVTIDSKRIMPISHSRILVIMGVLSLLGTISGFAFVSAKFGLGVLAGSILAFVNYYWLKVSLKKVFDGAAEAGEKPRLSALRYFMRYAILACVVAVLYATGAVDIMALILGMAGFGFAVVIEGFLRIFTGVGTEPPA